MSNIFADEAWEEYVEWQIKDKKIAIKINDLIKDINRNGLDKVLGNQNHCDTEKLGAEE